MSDSLSGWAGTLTAVVLRRSALANMTDNVFISCTKTHKIYSSRFLTDQQIDKQAGRKKDRQNSDPKKTHTHSGKY